MRRLVVSEFVSVDGVMEDHAGRTGSPMAAGRLSSTAGRKASHQLVRARVGAGPILAIAGPREENLVDAATLLVARQGAVVKVEGVTNPADPDARLLEPAPCYPALMPRWPAPPSSSGSTPRPEAVPGQRRRLRR